MINIFYNITIQLYAFAIWVAGFFNEKARKMIIGRRGLFEDLTNKFISNNSPIAWFHCASLGEFEQGRPVIEAFSIQYPDYKILLTFFSPSGFEIRKNYDKAHIVSYLPFDTFENANQFISIVKPKIVVFVKYEFWNNYLTLLSQKKIPTYLISANFRNDQIFFKSYGSFFRKILSRFNHIFVQNRFSEKLLQSIGYHNITLAGDTRFDRVYSLSKTSAQLDIIEIFKGKKKLFVLGSAWKEDVEFLISFFNEKSNEIQVVIAPHEINAEEISNWQHSIVKKSLKYSEIINKTNKIEKAQILFIDNIGMLSSTYKYADFVWIGGAFGKGLHNILEAATFGKPIFFGSKNYTKFQEAVDLVNLGGAFPFETFKYFIEKYLELSEKADYFNKTCQISKSFVEDNIGATAKIMEQINKALLNDIKL